MTKCIKIEGMCYGSYPIGSDITATIKGVNMLAPVLLEELKSREIATDNVTLVCTGSSGAIISALLAIHLPGCVIKHLKKDGENSHSSLFYINHQHTIIFVDDFMASGDTYNRVYDACLGVGKKIDMICLPGYAVERVIRKRPVELIINNQDLDI